MTRTMLFYGHVASNWGDLAINAGALELMRRADIDVEDSTAVLLGPSDQFRRQSSFTLKGMELLTVPTDGTQRGGRDEIELLIDYVAHPQRFADDTGMADTDFIVLNAGEHLFESATGENLVDLVWRVLPALAAQSADKPVVLLPSTIGPFRTAFGTALEEFLHHGFAAAAFRDTESRRLESTRMNPELPVLLDPGFFVPGLRAQAESERDEDVLGIVLRPEDMGIRPGSRRSAFVQNKLRESQFQQSQAFQLFASIAEDHLAHGGRVKIIVQTRADREISTALTDYLSTVAGGERVELIDPQGFRTFVDELGRLGFLVTSRFHSVILASAQAVPSVGVYSETHGHKMPGIFDLLKFPDCAVRLDDRSIATVREEVDAALSTVRGSIDEIHNRIRANRSLVRRWFDDAIAAQDRPQFDSSALQIEALSLLYRTGLDRAQKESLSQVLQAMRDLQDPGADSVDDTPGAEPR
ncbi:polysaccharide pyruvyl transferase family protein [Brevibacterium atlanticum]|uniref:polysaccharide pyruvyl transferase family protein n=1 Tax=Brevibacterium atlanticum TaxID=2697563 RepID=UPI00141D8CDD|nr:polysaccharide pyruvyl transferase family protein [Brevibacterium atlanticum]